jgi:GNAT superfamily N-acetyltransferase
MEAMTKGVKVYFLKELGPGREAEALSFLERDAVRNLRIIWALRKWGLFNLGLPEQGVCLACYEGGWMRGLLFRNNLGLWRLAAEGERAALLGEQALKRWGMPEVLAGAKEEVEALLNGLKPLGDRVEHREEELSLLLDAPHFLPGRGHAVPAREEDLDDLVCLEMMMQRELLGDCSPIWAIRLRMLRLLEEGGAALVRCRGQAVAKAEIDATTPAADELGGVYTLPGFRRRGYARSACSVLCRTSLRRGKKVRLETQRENHAAVNFYHRLGFKPLWPHLTVRFKAG